jgi:hypothetical protein
MATRREFIKAGSVATLAGLAIGFAGKTEALGSEGFFQIPEAAGSDLVNSLSSRNFKPLVGSKFRIRENTLAESYDLKLVEVKDLKFGNKETDFIDCESYSLLFEAPKGNLPDEGIYEVGHKNIKNFKVFVSPVTNEDHIFEINFNRMIK